MNMIRRIKSNFIGGFLLGLVSLVLIIIGAILTFTIVFSFIGITLLIIGIIFLVLVVFSLLFGTLRSVRHILLKPFGMKKKRSNVIDLERKEGVYRKA